jgi:protein HIRA/HIR1
VSIWQTTAPRPLLVARAAFERSIMDLSWAPGGRVLYAVSADGTLGAFAFEKGELEGVAGPDEQRRYLRKFPFRMPPLPPGHVHPPELATGEGGRSRSESSQPSQAHSQVTQPQSQREVVNTLIAKRKPKPGARRVGLLSNVPTSAAPPARVGTSTNVPLARAAPVSVPASTSVSAARPPITRALSGTRAGGITTDGFGFDDSASVDHDHDMDADAGAQDGRSSPAPIAALDAAPGPSRAAAPADDARVPARTLGGDRRRESAPARELATGVSRPAGRGMGAAPTPAGPVLPVPPLMSVLTAGEPGSAFHVQGKNAEDGCERFWHVSDDVAELTSRCSAERGCRIQRQQHAVAGLPARANCCDGSHTPVLCC